MGLFAVDDELETRWGYYFIECLSHDLVVQKSNVSNAGLGLFAGAQGLPGQTIIGEYLGTTLSTKEAMRVHDKSYLMRLGPQVYIDAQRIFYVLPRYINDSRPKRRYNVYFDKLPHQTKAHVITLRSIQPFEELYVDYGPWYWLSTLSTMPQ